MIRNIWPVKKVGEEEFLTACIEAPKITVAVLGLHESAIYNIDGVIDKVIDEMTV